MAIKKSTLRAFCSCSFLFEKFAKLSCDCCSDIFLPVEAPRNLLEGKNILFDDERCELISSSFSVFRLFACGWKTGCWLLFSKLLDTKLKQSGKALCSACNQYEWSNSCAVGRSAGFCRNRPWINQRAKI